LGFLSCLGAKDGPVLDLGCGMGHLTWSIGRKVGPGSAIGVDVEFGALYFAANLIAPSVSFICTSADCRLPLADGSFGAVVSSDALHYFMHRTTVTAEIERVLRPDGVAMLIGVRNRLCSHVHPPARFYPLAPAECRELMRGLPCRLIPDQDSLARYVRRLPPDVDRLWTDRELAAEPKISILATRRESLFGATEFSEWPHAEGRLGLNPLYRIAPGESTSTVQLQRSYPTDFYERENVESKAYLPEQVTVSSDTLTALREGRQTPEVGDLVNRFVALGLPDCYFAGDRG
jgi:SAM-dependent methyltransferase